MTSTHCTSPARVSNEMAEHWLDWRYATKKFDPSRTISERDLRTLQHALVQAPSSFGLQPWKFFVVTDRAMRETLKGHSWNQPQITDASHLFVLAAKRSVDTRDVDALITCISAVRGTPREALDGYRGMMVGFLQQPGFDTHAWATHQLYIALGMLMSTAASLGIDSCPMEGISPAAYDELLGLNGSEFTTKVACTLGYRAADDRYASEQKVRYPVSDLIVRK